VSNLLEAAFFSSATTHPFSIISTVGVRHVSQVRLPDPQFEAFLKQLPVLPNEVLVEAKGMVAGLQARGLLKPILFEDVLNELRSRPLAEPEMIACLTWWLNLDQTGDDSNLLRIRTELLNAAVLTTGTPGGSDERIIPLASISKIVNTKHVGAFIPADGPIPRFVLPLSVSKRFPSESLTKAFPWTELSMLDWLRHITNRAVTEADVTYDLNRSAPWAERVLTMLSRAWPSMSKPTQGEVKDLLKDKTCIPTSHGLRVPDQSYFANVNLFPDLSIVTMPSGLFVKGALEKVLQELGVRKHVELQIVFDRCV
jgi:hypothetical protein